MEIIRFNDIVADYYCEDWNTICAIIARWAPSMSWGKDSLAQTLLAHGIDSIIPDYYGYARSLKQFTPQNCIDTIRNTFTSIKWCKQYTAIYEQKIYHFPKYKQYIIVWHSFGGRITAMLPKFEKSIDTIALIAPQISSSDYNQRWYPEEDNEVFFKIIEQWYQHLYRWIDHPDRSRHFNDTLWLTPLLQPEVLKDINVFMGHGTADDVIRYGRSKEFYEILKKWWLCKNLHFDAYYGLWHGGLLKEVAATGIAHWMKTVIVV